MKNEQLQFEVVIYDDDRHTQQRLVIHDPEKFIVTSKTQREAYLKKLAEESGRIRDCRGDFLIGKNDSTRELENTGITVGDRRHFMQLLLYAQFGGKPLTKDGQALNVNTIAEIWGIARENASRKLKKFVDLKLLERVKDGRQSNFILNEMTFIMGRGVKPGEKFVKLFQNKLREVIENVQRIQDIANRNPKRKTKLDIIDVIGLLHAVMPYFHYQTYYLVSNPDDDICADGQTVLEAFKANQTGPSQLKHLSKSQIGRILGHKNANRATIDHYMDYLQRAGAVMILVSNNRTRYLIHPDLMFRLSHNGLDEYTEYVRSLFNEHR